MEWRVVARPVEFRKGGRVYRYAEVRLFLPVEYAGRVFVVKPLEEEAKPTWISEAVRDVFKRIFP